MKRDPGTLHIAGLVALVLITAACGREPSVASKSAEAYRVAQEKGTPLAGGHDHGGQAATASTAATATTVDHSAHGTASGDAHAAMGHGPAGGTAGDHRAHTASATAVDHAAMGHGTAASHPSHAAPRRTDAHAGHGTTPAGRSPHERHAAAPTAALRDQHAHDQHATGGRQQVADPMAGHAHHAPPTAPSPAMDHSAHAAVQPQAPDPHAGHDAAPLPAPEHEAPRTSAAIAGLEPVSTLDADRFDAAVPISVAEAVKAAVGGGHEGHDTRWITPGEDHANPPTPMAAVRTRANTEPTAAPTDHGQHGASGASAGSGSDVAVVYTCPMHPEVTSDKPGTCPQCGMALVRKK